MSRKVLFSGLNNNQIPYLKRLLELGFYVVGTDFNNDAPGKSLCHKFYNVGYEDFEGLVSAGEKEQFTSKDHIFTAGSQFAYRGLAVFAKHFSIPFPKPENIEICLDKCKYYRYFPEIGLPIPKTWFIENTTELKKLIDSCEVEKNFFLKSDYSKNPNYIYRFSTSTVPYDNIFWGKDRYLRKYYILQEEFYGQHLRVNLFGDRFNIFPFEPEQSKLLSPDLIKGTDLLDKIHILLDELGISGFLVKFDIIINDSGYVVLDIGLEPPYRMRKYFEKNNLDFAKYYIDQYINKTISYPEI